MSLLDSIQRMIQTHDMNDANARIWFDSIMGAGLNDGEKYKLLYMLDLDIQNNATAGMVNPVIRDILTAQGEIVLRGLL